MSKASITITAVSSLILASTTFAGPAFAAVDPASLPPCDFSNGVPQGMTLAELQQIATDKATYLSSPNPICNPFMGKGEIVMPLLGNENTTISWPVPYVAATPAPAPSAAPQVLAAQTAPILPVTGAQGSTLAAASLAIIAGLVACLRNR